MHTFPKQDEWIKLKIVYQLEALFKTFILPKENIRQLAGTGDYDYLNMDLNAKGRWDEITAKWNLSLSESGYSNFIYDIYIELYRRWKAKGVNKKLLQSKIFETENAIENFSKNTGDSIEIVSLLKNVLCRDIIDSDREFLLKGVLFYPDRNLTLKEFVNEELNPPDFFHLLPDDSLAANYHLLIVAHLHELYIILCFGFALARYIAFLQDEIRDLKKPVFTAAPPKTFVELFEHVSDYDKVLNILHKEKYINIESREWIDCGKGYQAQLIRILKALKEKGYYKKDLTINPQAYINVAKNTFGITVDKSTVTHNNPTPIELKLFPAAASLK